MKGKGGAEKAQNSSLSEWEVTGREGHTKGGLLPFSSAGLSLARDSKWVVIEMVTRSLIKHCEKSVNYGYF